MAKHKSQYTQWERYLFSAVRKIFRWTNRSKALSSGKIGVNKYQCSICPNVVNSTNVDIDHIDCVIKLTGWDKSWDGYLDRMFNGKTQLLCKPCHKGKTAAERKERTKNGKTEVK